MNCALELHDTRIIDIQTEPDGSGFVLLTGSVYYAEGTPGEGAQVSGWQNVRMTFSSMTVEGSWKPQQWIVDGSLSAHEMKEQIGGFFRIPASFQGNVGLSVYLPKQRLLQIRGETVVIEAEGEFTCEATWDAHGNRTSIKHGGFTF